jgi:hypothetical protein
LPPANTSGWPFKLIVGALVLAGASFGIWRAAQPTENEAPTSPTSPIVAERSAPVTTPPVIDREATRESAIQLDHAAAIQPALAKPKRTATPRQAPRTASPPGPQVAPSEVRAELALLRPARARVRSAPARALELVAEHERLYPQGALIEEREVIAIEALLSSERAGDAAQRARSFFGRYARSAHARRVRGMLEEAGIEPSGQD